MCAGLCRQRAAPREVLLSRGRRACTTAPRVKSTGERTWCTTQRHTCPSRTPLCVSKHTNKPAGNATYMSGPLNITSTNCVFWSGNVTKSSRVPDPTVDRHTSVNSGAERMGATTVCLAHVCHDSERKPQKATEHVLRM